MRALVPLTLAACGGITEPSPAAGNPVELRGYVASAMFHGGDSLPGVCTIWSPRRGMVLTAKHCLRGAHHLIDVWFGGGLYTGELVDCIDISAPFVRGDGVCSFAVPGLPLEPLPVPTVCAPGDEVVVPAFPGGDYRVYESKFSYYDGNTFDTEAKFHGGASGSPVICRGGVAGVATWANGGGFASSAFWKGWEP